MVSDPEIRHVAEVRKKRKAVQKKTDHTAILLRILTKYRSKPQPCMEELDAFSSKYRETAPLQSKQALWIAEAMIPPDELHSLFLGWNQFLKGLPMSDFGTSCELYEVNYKNMVLQFRDGIMRLRKKYPPSPANMLKIRKALIREAYHSDFRNRFPDEVQRYAVIQLFFSNPADGKAILPQLSPRMQKELAPIRSLIRKSAKH